MTRIGAIAHTLLIAVLSLIGVALVCGGAVCTGFGRGTGQIDLWRKFPKVNPGSYYSTSPVVVTEDFVIVGDTVLDHISTTRRPA